MKYYIKISDTMSEEKAVKMLEDKWGKVYENLFKYSWNKIIKLDNNNDIFYTRHKEQTLIEYWYTELTNEFIPWELVWVSDGNQEDADEDYKNANLYYIWVTKAWEYVIEDNDWYIDSRKYISKTLPKEEETRTIICNDKKWDEIKNILKLNK